MGKASKLLSILVTDPLLMETDEVKELIEKGHTVIPATVTEYDMVLGPNAWMMTPDLIKYIPLAVRAARDRKYGQPGVKEKHDSTGSGEGGGDEKSKRKARAEKAAST